MLSMLKKLLLVLNVLGWVFLVGDDDSLLDFESLLFCDFDSSSLLSVSKSTEIPREASRLLCFSSDFSSCDLTVFNGLL